MNELAGAYDRHPERRRAREQAELADDRELGDPPAHVKDSRSLKWATAWREIVAAMVPGVASRADVFAIERASWLLAQSRTSEGITAAQEGNLARYLSAFGMTPESRTKFVKVPEAKEPESPWDRLSSQ